jgi:hypothetical protein
MSNYLLLVLLPKIGAAFFGFAIFSFIISCLAVLNWADEHSAVEISGRNCINSFIATVFLFFIAIAIPTKKEMIMLKGLSVVSELKGVNKIPQNLVDKINNLLEDKTEKNV